VVYVRSARGGRKFVVKGEMMLRLWKAWMLSGALWPVQKSAYRTVAALEVVEGKRKMDKEER
jgi:hypothetical protein